MFFTKRSEDELYPAPVVIHYVFPQDRSGGVKNSSSGGKPGEEWVHHLGSCQPSVLPWLQREPQRVSSVLYIQTSEGESSGFCKANSANHQSNLFMGYSATFFFCLEQVACCTVLSASLWVMEFIVARELLGRQAAFRVLQVCVFLPHWLFPASQNLFCSMVLKQAENKHELTVFYLAVFVFL